MIIIGTILAYFCILLLISRATGHKADNEAFFRANGRSPWYLVAFGMIGASISGVTFVSVPGMVMAGDMTYMQTCLGFILGYFAVAFLLLPVYYRLRLTTIYAYLRGRLGRRSYKTGAGFFLLSKMTGAAVRFYVVCIILQQFVLDAYGIPFPVTVTVLVALIWLYTRRGGIRTLVLTDTFQTLCMLLALVLIIYKAVDALGMTLPEAARAIAADSHSRIFVFDDWMPKQNFWKQFLSGIFIVIVMTGLDQDMMQKNLTCKTLHEAQKDMCTYGFAFVPANLLFLSLGVLLMMYFTRTGQPLPALPDDLMLQAVAGGQLGTWVVILFTIGIVAACFSSADSALTALTTTFCVDICNREKDERLRRKAHLGVSVVFVLFILVFRLVNSTSLIDAIYTIVSYTYGPLLGLFSFGLLTKRSVNDRYIPYVAVASPLLCFALDTIVSKTTGYQFGYELLMLNGLITFSGCWLSRQTAPAR
ncbi:sodium:solute symporter [Prevotella multiformis]|uniref:Transporter, SSS family n=1 Tax=Prevotella multiformis DSM 16608 TaxID=888743 RepID=F0F8S2_9BACT|nr:sodium:solute symporter [Prevotella multiformis]EGC19449.1 transporter, SSS family [Prevotella multiformis DSM 16608]